MIDVMGEAVIDLIETADGSYRAVCGGSPANVALGVARLAAPCRFLGRISTDRFGARTRARLTDSGVDLGAVVSTDLPATLAIVSLDTSRSARYSFYVTGTADWQWNERELPADVPEVFHTGSLTAALPPGADVVTAHMRRLRDGGDCLVSYDPNIRPGVIADQVVEAARVEQQASLAHLVKVSVEDLAWLYPGRSVDDCVGGWRGAGVAADVIVTFGADGARLYRADGERVERRGVSVAVADTVGAGDAFTAGVLAELSSRGQRLVEGSGVSVTTAEWSPILDFANLVAAETCRRPGADPPRRDQLPPR